MKPNSLFNLAKKLFPIYRSITGDGVRKTLQILKSKNKLNAIGPLPSIPSKVKGNSRFHLVLQSSTKTYLNRVLKFLINEFEYWPEAK